MTLARSSSDLISVYIYGTEMTLVIHAGSGLCTALLAWRMDAVFLIMFLWEAYAMQAVCKHVSIPVRSGIFSYYLSAGQKQGAIKDR